MKKPHEKPRKGRGRRRRVSITREKQLYTDYTKPTKKTKKTGKK